MDVYKSLNVSIITVMKNSEMLKFNPDHLKTKKMCKHAVKNYFTYRDMFLINTRLNKSQRFLKMVEKLFLTAIKIKKCVIKLSRITLML